jgi:hypothetical protein
LKGTAEGRAEARPGALKKRAEQKPSESKTGPLSTEKNPAAGPAQPEEELVVSSP